MIDGSFGQQKSLLYGSEQIFGLSGWVYQAAGSSHINLQGSLSTSSSALIPHTASSMLSLRSTTFLPSKIPASPTARIRPSHVAVTFFAAATENRASYRRWKSTEHVVTEQQHFEKLPTLIPEQEEPVQSVLDGYNVLFTGPAGSGKSLIIKHMKQRLHHQGTKCVITATTGLAASLLSGRTVHNFVGIGLGDRPLLSYLRPRVPGMEDTETGITYGRRDRVQNKIEERLEAPGLSSKGKIVLIIDEASMVRLSPSGCRHQFTD